MGEPDQRRHGPHTGADPTGVLEVIDPGPLTTVQDLGRPGFAHLGVPPSGAADSVSLVRANRLVGNPDGAAALETTLTGPRLRAIADCVVAVCGAPVRARIGAEATGGVRECPMDAPTRLSAGETLRLGTASTGLRTYLAVSGGIDVPPILGSRSHDMLTGLGPPPLRAGDRLDVAEASAAPRAEAGAAARAAIETAATVAAGEQARPIGSCARLRAILGPRDALFTAGAIDDLLSAEFTVTSEANRIGVRLDGPSLAYAGPEATTLRSEGIATGAIQVPPDGRPVLLLTDHPTTGGYPVIAVVADDEIPKAAQLRPGTHVRFAPA